MANSGMDKYVIDIQQQKKLTDAEVIRRKRAMRRGQTVEVQPTLMKDIKLQHQKTGRVSDKKFSYRRVDSYQDQK